MDLLRRRHGFRLLLPAVGTLLVWVPAGVYLFVTGHEAMAFVLWAWGALVVVGFSDYVIRPRLVGDEGVPGILVFIALFGGLEVFGLSGLIAGPLLIALAVAVIRLRLKMKPVREAPGQGPRGGHPDPSPGGRAYNASTT